MNLNEEQKAAVAAWVEEGASLSDVQRRIKEEFGISMTYRDVRFLVDDLKIQLKEPEVPEPPKEEPKAEAEPLEGEATGKVSVTVDQITRPNAMISGKVSFSDGQRAEWYLDSMGRLGINPEQAGYRPAQDDVLQFQMELQRVVQRAGY